MIRIIAGSLKGRLIKTPKALSTRPTQSMLREAVFNICQNEIEGALFLDLFAGSGAMGIEALSRGAAKSVFVEQNRAAFQCIEENIKALALQTNTQVFAMDANKAIALLTKQAAKFTVVYIDPPYDTGFELTLLEPILAKEALIFLETRHDPKRKQETPQYAHFQCKDTRRFGIANLTIFRHNQEIL